MRTCVNDAAPLSLDGRTYDRALDCVQCGLCLPSCPTYVLTGREADSPRGRIHLMKSLADGQIDATTPVVEHLDRCLDCRACESACPSGVVYHELIEETRERIDRPGDIDLAQRITDWLIVHVLAYPSRMKPLLVMPRLLQKLKLWPISKRISDAVLPASLAKLQRLLPDDGPIWPGQLKPFYPAKRQTMPNGEPAKRIGFFAGCVGSVMQQELNLQTIALLQHIGCEVVVPRIQQCCGAIHHHSGHAEQAKTFAKNNIDAFKQADVAFIINNAAGCGAMLKEYGHLLRDDEAYINEAEHFESSTRDICEFLYEAELGEPANAVKRTATYHDACHLAHGQKITSQPRTLLQQIDGLTLLPLAESDMCCGAAGTYNLTQPQMAESLAKRKLGNIESTSAKTCITANVGCAMQIQSEANIRGLEIEVVHPVTMLYEAHIK